MSIKLKLPDLTEMRPRIVVIGVGGAGGNAINNMINSGIEGVEFVAANTDAQALSMSSAGNRIQMGASITEGLGAGSKPEIGAAAAEEAIDEIRSAIEGAHMLFITAGMGGGTGTGAAPVIARVAKELGVLTVAVVSKPFEFEGQRRMRVANQGVAELSKYVDTMIVIPNQNLFRIANEKTTFVDAFQRADDVLKSGIACITDLMVKEGLINLDFADVRVVMQNMGTALMGTGEAEGEKRALKAAEAAISNPLLGEVSMRGASGLLVSITGAHDMTLYEVEEAASRIRREVDPDTNPDVNIIVGATFDPELMGRLRVSVVATGIQSDFQSDSRPAEQRKEGLADRIYGAQGKNSEPAWNSSQLPASARGAGRSGGVTIEPRHAGSAPADSLRNGAGRQAERPVFEPAPPRTPLKPPRRPLTSEDFPELAGKAAPTQRGIAGGQRSRGGFLDWMTGRSRAREASGETESVAPAQRDKRTVSHIDPSPVTIERIGDGRINSQRAGDLPFSGRADLRPGERKAIESQPEDFEIPGFFKKNNG